MWILTQDLVLDDIPSPDADIVDLIRFAATYREPSLGFGKEMVALADRWREDKSSVTLRELRDILHADYRAHRHSGGYPDGPLVDEIRQLVRDILERLVASALEVWCGDITTLEVDGVVNAANKTLMGGGGVDGAIHRAAGPGLLDACRAIPEVRPGVRCPTTHARITPGFRLPAQWVIHTVGPRWKTKAQPELDALAATYRSALEAAAGYGLESVAFPAISTGIYGFPASKAARVAVEAVRTWLLAHRRLRRVVLVAFDAETEDLLRAALEAKQG